MNKTFRPEIFLFYVLAAIGCGDENPAADAGKPPELKPGDSCTPADPPPTRLHPKECNGGSFVPPGQCRARYDAVRCYIADAPGGQLACAPHDEEGLLKRVQEPIGSSGFQGEFVFDSADSKLLTEPDDADAGQAVRQRSMCCYWVCGHAANP